MNLNISISILNKISNETMVDDTKRKCHLFCGTYTSNTYSSWLLAVAGCLVFGFLLLWPWFVGLCCILAKPQFESGNFIRTEALKSKRV